MKRDLFYISRIILNSIQFKNVDVLIRDHCHCYEYNIRNENTSIVCEETFIRECTNYC